MSQHEFTMGTTRSGKSYHAQVDALRWPGPVLFYNPQDQTMDVGEWTRVTPADRLSDLINLLRWQKRARVVFSPHWHVDVARRQLEVIVNSLMLRIWTPPLLVVVDECDQVAPEGKLGTPAHQIAQRGGKQQVWGNFVTQHPAVVSKMIVRQCTKKTIFQLEDSAEYLTKYRMPGDQIEQILSSAPPYSYVVWERKVLSGPFKD